MLVRCPHCGGTVPVDRFGRRPLNIPVTKVYDAFRSCGSVTEAANKLGCSRAYVYKILKANGVRPEEVIKKRTERKTIWK